MKLRRSWIVAIAAAALAIPAAAVADPNGHSNGHANPHATGHGNPTVTYVFKGTYDGAGLVTVNHGNGHARKAGLVGTDGVGVDVQFDLTSTKLTVADTNADGVVDATDVVTGDAVVVKARLGRTDPGAQPFAAKHLVDQTNPPADDGDTGDTGDGA
jgi:hypothetical protein